MASCRLFHVWGNWKVTDSGPLQEGDRTIGLATFQKRTCYRCGYTQMDTNTTRV